MCQAFESGLLLDTAGALKMVEMENVRKENAAQNHKCGKCFIDG